MSHFNHGAEIIGRKKSVRQFFFAYASLWLPGNHLADAKSDLKRYKEISQEVIVPLRAYSSILFSHLFHLTKTVLHSTRQKLKWPISVIPSVAEGYSMSRLIAISLHSRCSVEMTFLFLSCTMQAFTSDKHTQSRGYHDARNAFEGSRYRSIWSHW